MKYGLNKEVIDKINSIFAKHSDIEKVILYGSRAKGNYKNGSDIDLTIVGKIELLHLHKIENELDNLLLPYTLDLSVMSTITSKELLEHIQRVGVDFYERDV